MAITHGYCTLAELKRYLGQADTYTALTISFAQATKKISDSASGLINFATSDTITVSGSTSNDGTYTIATGGVAAEIVVNEALTNEAAGDTVTIAEITYQKDDPLLESLVEAASRAIDAYCSRRFDSTTATRYYEADAIDGQYLRLDDDLISITTLTNGDDSSTVIGSSYYWLWPRNSGPPYHSVRLKETGTTTYSWEQDTDYFITVAGAWGWASTVPDNINHACIRLAAYMYHQKDSGVYDVTTFPEQGIIMTPQGMPRDVKILIDPYRRLAG